MRKIFDEPVNVLEVKSKGDLVSTVNSATLGLKSIVSDALNLLSIKGISVANLSSS